MRDPEDRSADRARSADGGGGRRGDERRPGFRYPAYVGIAFLVVAGIAVVNSLGTDAGGVLGAGDRDRGLPLAEFAVPEALGPLEGDANIAQDDCETADNPCPADRQRVPACEIEPEGALRICDQFDRPLALSFWFTRGGDCLPTQDAFDVVAERLGDRVGFVSVNLLDDRDRVREIVRERGWSVPVGHDADGAVSNLYRVGVCPTILLAYPGGILHAAEVKPGNFDAGEIEELVAELLRASRQREAGGRRLATDRRLVE